MALRNPVYLDMETLAAHADYHDIEYPVSTEVIEKTSRGKSGEASARVGGVGGQLRGGNDVELQRSYTLAPKDKAVVSRVIDALIHEKHAQTDFTQGVARNDLVEIEGVASLLPTSAVGKLMHLALLAVQGSNVNLTELKSANLEPAFMEHAKSAYIDNALLPIPLLFQLSDSPLQPAVFLDLDPGHFVDSHTLDDVEGEVQVLATVSRIIDDGAFYSAERWLLPGWERQIRRLLMASPDINQTVQKMATLFDVNDERTEMVEPYLRGPAIILTALSIY